MVESTTRSTGRLITNAGWAEDGLEAWLLRAGWFDTGLRRTSARLTTNGGGRRWVWDTHLPEGAVAVFGGGGKWPRLRGVAGAI